MAPGTLPASDTDAVKPLSSIGRIKSQKALAAKKLAAADANGDSGKPYVRGAKGQLEDMDRLMKLPWCQVRGSRDGGVSVACGGILTPAPPPPFCSHRRSCWRSQACRRC